MLLLLIIFIFILNVKTDEHEIITINLQGKNFKTSRQTLYEIPYFKSLAYELDKSNEFYLDRSAHIFKHILAWAVDNNYQFPEKYRSELKFFDINIKNVVFENIEITCY
jgi:hypothetical protein